MAWGLTAIPYVEDCPTEPLAGVLLLFLLWGEQVISWDEAAGIDRGIILQFGGGFSVTDF